MSDSKLFVFGSFSEDETRSLLQKQSPGKAEKPVEKNVLQFGSINFVSKISSCECNGESSRPQNSVKGLSKVQPLSSLNKQNEAESVKAANDSLPASLTTPTENGCTDNYKNGSAHSNGVKEATTDNIDVASLPLSNNEGGLTNQFSSLELQNREHNGHVDDLSASKVKGELQKCLNGPVTVSTVLLPRGLINSGNLCFLNATLQALLSCSPFVQLLQELRTRKVPKSSSLNLTCLVVQVQRTKMQVFLRLVGLLALPCLKVFLKFLLQMYELASRAGQGGLKLWEGSLDLVKALSSEVQNGHLSFTGKRVLELGCGHGLPGVLACLEGAAAIHFQDFNAEVLQFLTIPNVNSNVPSFQPPALQVTKCDAGTEIRLFGGDWHEIHKLLPYAQNIEKDLNVSTGKSLDAQYDIILMVESLLNLCSPTSL